jgi:hypothetical protein
MARQRVRRATGKADHFEIDEEQQDLVAPYERPLKPGSARDASGAMQMATLQPQPGLASQLSSGKSLASTDESPLALEIKGQLLSTAASSASSSARPLVQEDDGGALDPERIPPQYNPAWASARGGSEAGRK